MVYNINDIENIYLSLTFLLGKTIYIYTQTKHTFINIYTFYSIDQFFIFLPKQYYNLKKNGSHLRTMAGKYNLRKST